MGAPSAGHGGVGASVHEPLRHSQFSNFYFACYFLLAALRREGDGHIAKSGDDL